ncbi:thermostable hemolysin [Alicyclobacillus vulcanalis]|uniref:Thermostable hemolysin n=1 Tax=Alicyclobacillus vulcanalis TaxID=252246 RepID=A0A1N7PQN0_9BACL|nr:thermostable hemolysin [Alicyclobacillus vulcanalis]SIT12896.1 Thermostable hemolysin [Alicyclobacillus vulcanalis]
MQSTVMKDKTVPASREINVCIANTAEEIQKAMEFCGRKYEEAYGSRWKNAPDILFVAYENHEIVATLGLELGKNHREFGAERYFMLTPRMRAFLDTHRYTMGELGRFSSIRREAARAVFHAAITYALESGLEFLVAWANPGVYNHLASYHGIPFWVVDVPVNAAGVENDMEWTTPPRGFFFREEPPKLLLSIAAFWDLVNKKLAGEHRGEIILLR